jgi:hypothetical protein
MGKIRESSGIQRQKLGNIHRAQFARANMRIALPAWAATLWTGQGLDHGFVIGESSRNKLIHRTN